MPARKRGFTLLAIGSTLLVTAGAVVTTPVARAATGCRVTYSVASQWPGGFGANVNVTNLGDPITSWNVQWTFAAGQTVAQAWNATVTQSGGTVSAANVGWNGALATNASTSFGFNGSWNNSANPVPTSFTLNGVACTGSTSGTTAAPATTRAATSAPVTTRAATSAPVTSRAATSRPPTSAAATTRPPVTNAPWNPPSNLTSALAAVWSHQESTYSNLYGFRNYGWDQVMAGQGTINYCVRWDSGASVTTAQRDAIHAALSKQFNKWMTAMSENGAGWNGWPYPQVNVKVVGWAVRDRAQLQWSDSSVDIYVNNIRENAPQCSEPCGRFFHQDGNYSGCPGGASRHYDMSLWLTAGMGGGAGGDWGQRMGSEYFMGALGSENIHIYLHEVGHTFGLDDFYDWDPGVGGFIMKAGSASQITEFDKWMLRDWWRHLKSRYGR
ncbi:hypothetical protein GCM10009682_14960 [Luedemannella flava]|uniref:CBM2 domain-containing protein n=1 Tax=Luedemannella flava TaxID=349316 RepID=A0ABP4XYW1_9ACTN